ncbi:MAG: SAM-dependent chlorinase/fluorinase [Bacteroidetes bacterium]|nr:SAM-dependent chlorinase/fluorinase [Rhodothermia bacterium]MCS7154188.1 SAM-dependent chlorinase/fluorinase [Bacteroidota bacterium]MCX7906776.1 SAM-dependent chlorinase/fluorinase [Bacteroidota bacterium]MDW8136944.1 SAM-dependent chlorinase/fluorinase [Bacteroidota bacterium]MDW8285185.1 SAM-dependent chlorinase/fluorinase [Bacteroidota bacterium]
MGIRVRMARIITLLTDFGTADYFVGAMKGEILCRAPDVHLVDLSHEIRPHDILHGAFVLRHAYAHFPPETIHVFVVDPGVGSQRRPVAVRANGYYFVGPDNGLLKLLLDESPFEAVVLDRPEWFRPEVSRTFHGRDIFAPVAAHLANGVPLEALGSPIRELTPAQWTRPIRGDAYIVGQILHVDRFGNLITNIRPEDLPPNRTPVFTAKDLRCRGLVPAYAAVDPGQALAIVGSAGFIELAIREGSAAGVFDLKVGQRVLVSWEP